MSFRLPYPGLRAFNRDESDLFFGRDGCVDDMVNRLAATRFLAVLGASGTGKSSLVRTGLLDALELGLHPAGSAWRICDFSPGGDPFSNLSRALIGETSGATAPDADQNGALALLESFLRRGPRSVIEWAHDGNIEEGENLLLLVDQFEELFRFAHYSEREDAEAFAKLLICCADTPNANTQIVVTMRSEFLGACALLPGLAEKINIGAYLTPRMIRAECEAAIVGPARVTGVEIEPRLVTRLLNDMESFAPWGDDQEDDQVRRISRRADQLPVMQHVLNRMARRVHDAPGENILNLQHYEELGGLSGALNAHGEELLALVGAERLPIVEKLFRALVTGNSPETATRRPLALQDIAAPTGASRDEILSMLDIFRSDDCNFLRPDLGVRLNDRTVVDISHESLIRQWSALSEWVVNETRSAAFWRRLAAAAEHHARGEGELLAGLDLDNLANWWRTETPQIGWAARYSGDFKAVSQFLDESIKAEEQKKCAETEREHREKLQLQSALNNAEDNLKLAIGATEKLALRVAQKFETNKDIDTAAKLIFIEEIEKRFEQMSGSENPNSELRIRKAELLITNARMLTEVGYLSRAIERAEEANALLFPGPGRELAASNTLKAKAKLAMAEAYYYRTKLAQAQSTLDQARSHLKQVNRHASNEAVLSARIGQLQADLYRAHDRFYDEIIEIDRTIREAKPYAEVPENADIPSAQRQTLNEIIARLYIIWMTAKWELDIDTPGLVDDAVRFVSERFADLEQPGSNYLRSMLTSMVGVLKSDRWSDENKYREAFAQADEAVNKLDQLCLGDFQNLACRRELAHALIRRSRVSRLLFNYQQARADISSARTIAYHLKLDDGLSDASLSVDIRADYESGRLAEQSGKRESTFSEYRRIGKRLELVDDSLDKEYLTRRYGAIEAWGAAAKTDDSAQRLDEIIKISERQLELYGVEPDADEDRIYAAKQRYYAYVRLLEWSPADVGEDDWNRYLDGAMKEASYLALKTPDKGTWLDTKCYLIGKKAEVLRDKKNDVEGAASAFIEAINACGSVMKMASPSLQAVQNAAYYARQVLDMSPGSIAGDRALAVLSDYLNKLQEMRAPVSMIRDAESHLAALDKSVSALLERLGSGGKADPGLLKNVKDQKQRLASLRESGATGDTESAAGVTAVVARDRGSAFDLKDLVLGDAGKIEKLKKGSGERINWSAPPLYSAPWLTLLDQEQADALEKFAAAGVFTLDDLKRFAVRVRRATLDFYDEGYLLDAEIDYETGPRIFSLLVVRNTPLMLNGTSPPIHETNARGGLRLDTPGRAAAYLRFFCAYVNGEEGSFQLVEYVNDLIWDSSADARVRESVARLLRPVVVWKEEKGSGDTKTVWSATATVQYSNAIFFGKFGIQAGGIPTMFEDEPVMADLPINPTRVTRSGRVNDPIKRVSFTDHGIAIFDDDAAFLTHLLKLPAEDRPRQFERIVREAVELVGLATDDATKLNQASYALIKSERMLDRAVEFAEQANKLTPSNPNRMDTLAWGYVNVGRLDDAIKLLEKAVTLDSTQAEFYAHLGQAYRLKGDLEKSRTALDKARALDGTKEWATFIDDEYRLLEAK